MIIGIDGNEANLLDRVGSNIYAYQLILALRELDKLNEYRIYLKNSPKQDLPKTGKKLSYRVLTPKKLWTRWRLPLDLYFNRPRPNVFFTPGHYAPRFSPVPKVMSILDLSFLDYPEAFKPTVLNQLKSWTKQSALSASHILTISKASKADIIKHYGISPSKITVTYPGIDRRFYRPVTKKCPLKKPYLLFIGTKQPKKNLFRLIQAFRQVSRAIDYPLNLVIVGKTWSQFKNQTIPQAENIKQLGFVKDADLPAIIKGAAAFVLPSLYEGFGLPVAEAMAVGTPVVTSNISSLPEVVGTAGILVDPLKVGSISKGLNQVLSLSKQKKVQLIKQAKAQVKQFTWENCARKTLEVLNATAL